MIILRAAEFDTYQPEAQARKYLFPRLRFGLVYADFYPSRTGCSVVAYDLKNKKQLWKTDLKGLGPIAHFRYANSVTLEIINNDAVRVFGNESAGQYLEIVDLKTGRTVGHQTYKK